MTANPRFGGIFDYAGKCEQLEEVERELAAPAVWDDPDRAQKLGQQRAALEQVVSGLGDMQASLADLAELAPLAGQVARHHEAGLGDAAELPFHQLRSRERGPEIFPGLFTPEQLPPLFHAHGLE